MMSALQEMSNSLTGIFKWQIYTTSGIIRIVNLEECKRKFEQPSKGNGSHAKFRQQCEQNKTGGHLFPAFHMICEGYSANGYHFSIKAAGIIINKKRGKASQQGGSNHQSSLLLNTTCKHTRRDFYLADEGILCQGEIFVL
ncbi:hypothetical protein C5167_021064 [Papaver somniferum]|uniref:Uncharacterized protein n=1 Tax=Papaver somniferum TaxID=3469 RepID=A0A4Y7IWW4_PAPSO|nr:hypothetical protein C5167_021064 [Papaver somniferum]